MLTRLEAEINTHFTEARIDALVETTRLVYDRAALHHSPEDGWDPQMFGFAVYKYVTKRLHDMSKQPALGFETRAVHPAFRLGVGPFTLAAYCCGSCGDQDINDSFPNNENGAPALVDMNQFSLDLKFDETVPPRALVLAHLGNPTNGLEALYLAAPGSKQDGRISEWSYTKLIWRMSATGGHGQPTPPQLPPPAPITPAPLSLKFPMEKRVGTSNRSE